METTAPAVFQLGFILALAALAGWAARRVSLPAVIGYLAVGILVSEFTPGYVADRHQLEVLADVGVVLLLFEVGIEIDPLSLHRDRGHLLLLAPTQLVTGALVAGAMLYALGVSVAGAALLGLSIAMSSSVVVVNITRSRRRTTDPATEEDMLGWSVLQDLAGVLCAALLLVVLGIDQRGPAAAALGLVAFVAIAIAAAWAIPRALRRLRDEHDLFLLASLASGLVVAGIGATIFGIPLALAAFIGGLAISEGRDAQEARERFLPFRDVFAVLFFVAIGTLIDPAHLGGALPWIAVIVALVIATKLALVYVLALVGRLAVRRLQLAVGLGQIGEFSFVLASLALGAGVIGRELYTAVLASVAITIAMSTVGARLFPKPRALAAQSAP